MKTRQTARCATLATCLTLGQILYATAPIYNTTPDFTVDLTNKDAASALFPTELIIDNNGDGCTWSHSIGVGMINISNEDQLIPADDWLVSKRIPVTEGHKYQIEIVAKANFSGCNERLEVAVSSKDITRANPQDLNQIVIKPTELYPKTPVTLTSEPFSADATGYFQVGIHAISDADMATLIVSAITVTDVTDQFTETKSLTISNLSVQTDADGTLTAGYKYPLDITLTNNLDHDTQPGTLTLTCGIEQPVKISYPAIATGNTYTLNTTCAPSLFEGNTYSITAALDDSPAQEEPTTTYLNLLRPIHACPINVTCRNLWQYEVLVQWQAPAYPANPLSAMRISPTDNPGQLTHYNIYRDGQLVGQVTADQHEFYDWNNTSARSTYHVVAQYENGTSDLSNPTTIDVMTGLKDMETETNHAYSISARTLTINTPVQITITDITGHTIYTATKPIPGTTISLAAGLYIITTPTGTTKAIIK